MSEIEIRPDPSGEPAKIFTDEEISKYDGSDVSLYKQLSYKMKPHFHINCFP